MLRLERVRKKSGITLLQREQSTFFASPLFYALLLSLILHCLWLLLFPIYSPYQKTETLASSSSLVDVDLSGYPSLFQRQNDEFSTPLFRYMVEPPLSQPTISPLPKIQITPEFVDLFTPRHPQFSSSTPPSYSPEKILFPFEEQQPSFTLTVSGPLTTRQIAKAPHSPYQIPRSHAQPCTLNYEVRVDARKGEVCWWKCLSSPFSPSIENLGEMILEQLQFVPVAGPGEQNMLTEGRIELYFNLDSRQPEPEDALRKGFLL